MVSRKPRKDRAAERALILSARDRYTDRQWGIVQFYYTCGLDHREIARIFGVARQTITAAMAAIRRKARGNRPYSNKPKAD